MSVLGSVLLVTAAVLAAVATVAWALAARAAPGGDRTSGEPAVPGRRGAPGLSEDLGRVTARVARAATHLATVTVLSAVLLLEVALLRHDTSLGYVTKVAGAELPAYYRVTALWSALEGSLLLWLLATALVASVWLVSSRGVVGRAHHVTATVLSGLVTAFVVVALLGSPFTVPGTGARPSPLLQDHVAMGLHPPLLYAGFTALAVPYALSVAGLLTGGVDHRWATRVRGWAMAAWVLLTVGIGLGAWWSYAVLGWGGYWAWDPVENASLLPWLTTTALLHTVGPRTRVAAWRTWAVALAGAGYLLVLLATFLTRSGVVESIHAFTTSPLGPALLVVLLAALVPWAVLAVWRRGAAEPTPGAGRPAGGGATTTQAAGPGGAAAAGVTSVRGETSPVTRQGAVQANRVLFVVITAIVLVGTVLPAVLQAVTGDRVAVGPPWYERTLAPVALGVLLLMAVGPLLGRRTGPAQLRRMRLPGLVGASVIGAVGFLARDVPLAITAGVAAFVLVSLLGAVLRRRRDRRAVGALLAHLGVALGAVAALAAAHESVGEGTLEVGESLVVEDVTLTLLTFDRYDEGRRSVAEAELVLGEAGQMVGTVRPQLRWYEQESTMLAGPEIRSDLGRDVYVTLLDVDPGAGLATVRLEIAPMMSLLWGAGALMVIGAAVAGWPRSRGPDRRGGHVAGATRDERRPAGTSVPAPGASDPGASHAVVVRR